MSDTQEFNVIGYGADHTGVNDSSAAFAAAFAAATHGADSKDDS